MRDVAVGVALALSAVAFILALWPAVADAPWETQVESVETDATPTPIIQPLSKSEQCLRLALLTPGHPYGTGFLIDEMNRLGCRE